MLFAALSANKEAHDPMAKEDALTQTVKAVAHADDQVRFQTIKVLAGFSRHERGRSLLITHKAVCYSHFSIFLCLPYGLKA